MFRNPGLSNLLLCLIFLCSPDLALGQGKKEISIQTMRLEDHLHLLVSGAGGNMAACVGESGLILVDSDYAQLHEKISKALAELSDQPLEYVINTHWHFDHVGGNEEFAKSGARLLAHENVRTRMAGEQRIGILKVDVPASPRGALPVITYRSAMTLHRGAEEIDLIHMPRAHTDGDTVLHFRKANVIHMGDIFFNPGYPFIDVTNGGTIDGMIQAVDAVLERCDGKTRIIPGHGPLADRADLESYGEMLKQFRAIVAREKAAGKDLKTLLAEKPTAALDQKYGPKQFPPDKFLEMVFCSLPPQ